MPMGSPGFGGSPSQRPPMMQHPGKNFDRLLVVATYKITDERRVRNES